MVKKIKTFCVCPGLRFLVRLCTDMGLKEVQEYTTKLKKVEKMKEIREQVCLWRLSHLFSFLFTCCPLVLSWEFHGHRKLFVFYICSLFGINRIYFVLSYGMEKNIAVSLGIVIPLIKIQFDSIIKQLHPFKDSMQPHEWTACFAVICFRPFVSFHSSSFPYQCLGVLSSVPGKQHTDWKHSCVLLP